VIHLLGSSRGHGGRVQGRRRRIGVAERRFYYTGRLRGGSYELRAYTRVYARACTRARDCVAGGCAEERFRLGIIRIRNLFLPRGSTTTTSSYILLFSRRSPPPPPPALRPTGPARSGATTRCTRAATSMEEPSINPGVKCSAGGYVIFQSFMALSRARRMPSEMPRIRARKELHKRLRSQHADRASRRVTFLNGWLAKIISRHSSLSSTLGKVEKSGK
jgi:hypothetical protein